jgi:two-component system sensor histidine kinase CpxA
LPYFAGVILAIGLLGYMLAVHFARPLRELRAVVDRFGGGEHSARARSTRQDEIGELSRAFDAMAGQIQTLRTAELRLLQDVSHELRSPLARLGFNLELARSGDDPEVPFARIKKDLDRLATLVGEILQLTCAEGDPATRNLSEVELDELLGSLAEDCQAEAQSKSCRLTVRLEADARLIGDRELLQRGFENVLRNAIRHAPEGSCIELDSRVLDGLATITVRDHGPGVPDEALAAIFNPFFRVGDDRSRSGGGVGLGLSIARRAIELHEGRVIARNAAPGLRVFIDLPVETKVLA